MSPSSIAIIPATEVEWTAFLSQFPAAHHAFDWSWRTILKETFGHEPHYLMAVGDRGVEAIAPLFSVQSRLFGHSLISVPYLNSGGILGTNNQAIEQLHSEILGLGEQLQVRYVELRQQLAPALSTPRFSQRTHKVAMVLPLTRDSDTLFQSFSKKLRSQIRRPEKAGVTVQIYPGDAPDRTGMNAFYRVFAQNMRDLGTPVYPQKLFELSARSFGSRLSFIVASFEGRPVAAGCTIGQGRYLEIPWASSVRDCNHLSPNMLMYWHAIRNAAESGYDVFDFGRSSPDSGTFRFKAQWGAQPATLNWLYDAARSVPDVNPNSKKFSMLTSLWRKLPLPVANAVGPFITRHIP